MWRRLQPHVAEAVAACGGGFCSGDRSCTLQVVFDASMLPGAAAARRRGLMFIGNTPLPALSTVSLHHSQWSCLHRCLYCLVLASIS